MNTAQEIRNAIVANQKKRLAEEKSEEARRKL